MLWSSKYVASIPYSLTSGETKLFPGDRIERCLSYDEKPLALFQKLKDASKNPIFMVKHIKDIRSPIAVAQQRQAERKALGDSSSSKPKPASHARTTSRPPHLQVHPDASANIVPLPITGTSVQPGWPEVMSPAVDNKNHEDTTDWKRLKGASGPEPPTPKTAVPHTASASTSSDYNEIDTPAREKSAVTAKMSYALAIYPYMAEQEGEFDVVVYVSLFLLFHRLDYE